MCKIRPTSLVSLSRNPRSTDSPPHDLDNWRVLLPSRPRAEQVARLVPHKNASWDDTSDLVLLQLRAPVNLSVSPRPVCLPHPEHYFLPGSRCRLARWGSSGEQGPGERRRGAGPNCAAARASTTFSSRTCVWPRRAAGGGAVRRLVVSLPVWPPGGVGSTARAPAAQALPHLPGGGERGGPLLGKRRRRSLRVCVGLRERPSGWQPSLRETGIKAECAGGGDGVKARTEHPGGGAWSWALSEFLVYPWI